MLNFTALEPPHPRSNVDGTIYVAARSASGATRGTRAPWGFSSRGTMEKSGSLIFLVQLGATLLRGAGGRS